VHLTLEKPKDVSVFLVEDDQDDELLVREMLGEARSARFRVLHADRLADVREQLGQSQVDCILLDLSLPDTRRLEGLSRLCTMAPDLPIVILTGLEDERLAVEAVHEGAQDYLIKDRVDPDLLGRSITYAIERKRIQTDLQQFAFVASHDLSEPLRTVESYVQLLARRYQTKLDGDADEFIGFVVDGVERMKALIDALLRYSRAGSSEYVLARVNCSQLVTDTLATMRQSLEEAGAEVKVDPLPTVVADPIQLSQLFQNLISNAIKFVADKSPRVRISADQRPNEWRFSVTDNGIGIDPKHAERIFGVCSRLHGQDAYAGSGIGLAVCKRVVERHGGRTWVEPAPDGGSKFCFTIPDEGN
jgi:two-component system sensor histidine kinase/response regulator